MLGITFKDLSSQPNEKKYHKNCKKDNIGLKNKPRSEFLYSNENTYPSRDKASVLLIDDPQETFETCHSIKNR